MWKVGKAAGHLRTGLEGSEGKYSFFNLGSRWGGWSTTRPGRFTRGKQSRYPLCKGLGGPQGRSWRLQKIWPLPKAVDPRTIQTVASRYTDTLRALLHVRGGAVGWGTALQVGRSRVRFPMVSLEFFIDIILPAHYDPGIDSASNRNISWWVKVAGA